MVEEWLKVEQSILGFLSTEDGVIPGNNGLKDQVLAMKWVKLNIASFGGNPNSLALTGVSAGGASVHLHYFPRSPKVYLSRGISHSGTALDPWIIKTYPIQNTKKLALLVGCSDISSQEIKQCLKKKSALDLMLVKKYFYGYGSMPFTHSVQLWNRIGYYNDRELKNIDRNWDKISHYLLDYNFSVPIAKRQEVAQQIRDEYMDGHQINKKHFYRFTKIFTERLFTVGSEMAAKLQSKINTSLYIITFLTTEKGTNCIACNTSIQEGANLALLRNPATSRAVLWKPTKGDDLAYLNITNSDSMKMNSTKALTRADFWRKIGLLENESLQLAKDEL
ncbi:hypothetical protein NQ317_005500 [Molorchus minor]|uniref:Carboxylic ester hydrolase n=1 Tax=Molorchus minor TaxID=1323400 RepID=A0ABQ9IRW5_9CUCU|nr:hypothetical protein NQ317_005500 [Molorchus minor]